MIGILLINLGTPAAPSEKEVRDYLEVFLSDPYVITLPKLLRDFLVKKIILPKRPKKSAHAYQQIWTESGSPLLVNTLSLQEKIQRKLGNQYHVVTGMRYSKPSIEDAIMTLHEKKCEKMIVLPLYPQFANATTQSSLDVVQQVIQKNQIKIPVHFISDFYKADFYINALTKIISGSIKNNEPEFVLFSYHGLPQRQISKKTCDRACLRKHSCTVNLDRELQCYRAQCHATTELVAKQLALPKEKYQTAFQSRLGFTKWITPYTDQALKKLREKGVRHLAVVSPSFVADCVETLEEINIRLREQWMQLGGGDFHYIPCLNTDSAWVDGLSQAMTLSFTSDT